MELNSQNAEALSCALLCSLKSIGFNEEYFLFNWIAFVSDVASVLMGEKSGVATRLYETISTSFYMALSLNHHLELAVGDAVEDSDAMNRFKIFMDSLYYLVNQHKINVNCVMFLHN